MEQRWSENRKGKSLFWIERLKTYITIEGLPYKDVAIAREDCIIIWRTTGEVETIKYGGDY